MFYIYLDSFSVEVNVDTMIRPTNLAAGRWEQLLRLPQLDRPRAIPAPASGTERRL